MSLRTWIVVTQEQFDQFSCDWPENMPASSRKTYWVRMHFDGSWINKYATKEEALAEAQENIEEGFDGQLVVCGIDFDAKTCAHALNCLNTGDPFLDYYGICKEYTWMPHKMAV